MRVALFGGTFDPPHRGHLGIARAAADAFQLSSVLFTPVGLQPLKDGRTTTPFADRFAMVELACSTDPRFQVSAIDAPHVDGTPNYTVDTLATLRSQMPEAVIFSLIGADSFLSLRQWREPRRLLALAEWIVVSRPGSPLGDLASLGFAQEERKRIHLIESFHDEVSATELRQRLADGDSCRDLIPPAVADYILHRGLYRRSTSDGQTWPS